MDRYNPQFWEPNQKPEPGFDEINWDHPLTNGLVAEWLLNEGAGSQIRDGVAGIASKFTSNAPRFGPNYFGPALISSANTSTVTIGDFPQFRFTGNRAFSFVALASPTTADICVMGANVDANNRWFAYLTSATVGGFQRWVAGSFQTAQVPSSRLVYPMTMTIGTYDGATLTLSINGSARGTAASAGAISSGAMSFSLFTNLTAGIVGSLALVRLYNRALTRDEELETVRNPFAFYAPVSARSHGALAYVNSPFRSRILQSRILQGVKVA